MQLAYQFPSRALKHWDTWIGDHTLGEIAVAAEEAGFGMVSSTDHPFPHTDWVDNGGHHAFDPFVSLAFMAAATKHIKLLTMIVVNGYRNPYITAKAASSVDKLSGGRLVLGMGAGYQKAEFDVLGANFEERGKQLDSSLRAMRAAWTGEVVEFDDPYFPAHGHVMLPLSATPGGPPYWFGGNSKVAMRRVAEFGQGWIPIEQTAEATEITKTPQLASLGDLGDKIGEIRERRVTEFGRTGEFEVCFGPLNVRGLEANAERIAGNIPEYEKAGVDWVLVSGEARTFDDCLREIELYKGLGSPA
jgi:probable F420-dependent oxidoreductase